jgi:hypothetical protein
MRSNVSAAFPGGARHAIVRLLSTSLLLTACGGDGTGVDDGGDVPSSIRITAPAAPVIGDTIRIAAVARNRGGRELPRVVPAVSISVRGDGVRQISDGVALVTDTGRVVIVAVTASIRAEQTVTAGMPATLDIALTAPDSVSLGDSVQTTVAEVRRDGAVRTDLGARFVSSDTAILRIVTDAGRRTLRPVAQGQVTLTAQLGTRVVSRAVRVLGARIQSFAFVPTPSVLDIGDRAALTTVAFDVLGGLVGADEVRVAVLSGPGVLDGNGFVQATAPGSIVLRATARDRSSTDTVNVMPPSQLTITLRPGVAGDGTVSSIPPKLQRALDRAVKRWRQVIREDLPAAPIRLPANACRNPALDETVNGVLVHVRVPSLGFGGILAQATACVLRGDGRTIQGFMEFNADVLDRLGEDELFYTAAHELGHVFGVGTIWYRSDGLPALISRSGTTSIFVGPQANAQFDLLDNRSVYTGPTVPISADRGHWDPRVLLLELMEPFARATTRFSRLTVGAMGDMGYVVNTRSWDRYALQLPARRIGVERAFDLTGDVLPPFGVVQADGRVIPFR